MTKTDLPNVPVVGMTFRPDATDSLGTVTSVFRGKDGPNVIYSYAHAPEVSHSRPWREVVRMAWSE